MPFQSSDALDDQMLLDGSNGFSTGVISGTRPDAIPATSLESAINMDYDDFGNLVTRLGSASIVGNSITSHWEDVITNWESTTSNFASNLPINSQVYSGFYFDTSASERLVIALNDINANTNQLYYGSPGVSYNVITGSSFSPLANYVYFAQLNEKLFYSDGAPELHAACRALGITHEVSTPGQSQNNGIIERTHQEAQAGVAACLLQAGLPAQFWTFAAPCYCHLVNTDSGQGTSRWKAAFDEDFPGKLKSTSIGRIDYTVTTSSTGKYLITYNSTYPNGSNYMPTITCWNSSGSFALLGVAGALTNSTRLEVHTFLCNALNNNYFYFMVY